MVRELKDLDPKQRADEKAASRDIDERRLKSGEISGSDLSQASSAFGGVLSGARISSIGGKPVRDKGGR